MDSLIKVECEHVGPMTMMLWTVGMGISMVEGDGGDTADGANRDGHDEQCQIKLMVALLGLLWSTRMQTEVQAR